VRRRSGHDSDILVAMLITIRRPRHIHAPLKHTTQTHHATCMPRMADHLDVLIRSGSNPAPTDLCRIHAARTLSSRANLEVVIYADNRRLCDGRLFNPGTRNLQRTTGLKPSCHAAAPLALAAAVAAFILYRTFSRDDEDEDRKHGRTYPADRQRDTTALPSHRSY